MELGTALLIGTVLSAGGTALQAGMSYFQGKSQAEYARNMAARNATVMRYAAEAARDKASYESSLIRERGERMWGKQSALFGKLGVLAEGSPLEFMGRTAMEYERDALNTLYTGEYQAWQAKTQGQTGMIEGEAAASAAESRANMALFTAPFQIGSSILTGYGQYQAAKKFPGLSIGSSSQFYGGY